MNLVKPALAISTLFLSIALSACSTGLKKEDDPGSLPTNISSENLEDGSPAQLYLKAKTMLEREQYESALSNFENLEATHPFSEHAAQAQLDIAYAYFKLNEHRSAIAAADRFLKLYPKNENADYAYYLKAMTNFTKGRTLLEGLVPRKLHQLDQSALRLSFSDFSTMANRFPNSAYVADAEKRMQTLHNAMALHELDTAQYYFERSAMVAVINRVNTMLVSYPDNTHSADALSLLARAHRSLGNLQLAADAVAQLRETQPDHPDLKVFGNIKG